MNEIKPDISLAQMSFADAQCLWKNGHQDGDWPLPETRQESESFLRLVEEYQSLALLGLGDMLAIHHQAQLCGFVVCNTISDTWLPTDITAVECGTYLLPEYRGKGLNLPTKTALFAHVWQAYRANWCVFIVAEHNHRAQAAMKKLPWPFSVEQSRTPAVAPALAPTAAPATTTSDAPAVFQRYLRRKRWELGHDFFLYKLAQSAYQPV